MPRYRLSDPAKTDIAAVLATSETIHGTAARIRYRALLTAAMRRIAAEPLGLIDSGPQRTIRRRSLFSHPAQPQ